AGKSRCMTECATVGDRGPCDEGFECRDAECRCPSDKTVQKLLGHPQVCANYDSDPKNCRYPGLKCELWAEGSVCSRATCTCPQGTQLCDQKCEPDTKFKSDDHNCGWCSHQCPSQTQCTDGTCLSPCRARGLRDRGDGSRE